MSLIKSTACSLAILSATSVSALASTVDIRVIGTISPVACVPSLSGGGTIDYGTIHPTTMHATDYTVLPEKTTELSITCDAPAKVAIQSSSGRKGSLAGATEYYYGNAVLPVTVFGANDVAGVGLGWNANAPTEKIGGVAFTVEPSSVSVDGNAADVIGGTINGTWYHNPRHHDLFSYRWSRELTFAAPGTLVPMEFTTATATVKAQAYLNKRSELDLSKPVALDGLISLELRYL